MKRILIYLLSLLMLTAQAEDLPTPADVFVELPASEELFASEAVDEPVDEFEPFQIGEVLPNQDDHRDDPLLIVEEAHADEQELPLPIEPSDEQLIIEPETEAEAAVKYTVTCYATRTSLTYIFTPVAAPSIPNTIEEEQPKEGKAEGT